MVSKEQQKRDQAKRYRQRYPEKVKEMKKRYCERKIITEMKNNPEKLDKVRGKLLRYFGYVTRYEFDEILPKECERCGMVYDLHIHHLIYQYPVKLEHLVRLCRRCHTEEHQRLSPPKNRGDALISCGN